MSLKTVGVELLLSNDQSILLGSRGNNFSILKLSHKFKTICVKSKLGGHIQSVSLRDDQKKLICDFAIHNSLYEENANYFYSIPEDCELIGMSVSMEDGKFWPNF